MHIPDLLDAIRIVKENERMAYESYANAAKIVTSLGKKIFEQLSEFEKYHYEILSALEKSLEDSGEFINYQGKEFILPPQLVIKFAEEPDHRSILNIISESMKLEKQAQKAYADLAAQLTDPQGKKMFTRLSEEESKHYDLLSDAYASLNQTGVWTFSSPPKK
jgi:rubrerythrin